jgi:hypothetical protein
MTSLLSIFPANAVRFLCLVALHLGAPITSKGGTFSNDFDSGLPSGTKLYGDSLLDPTGGNNKSGVVKLTRSKPNLSGSFIIDPLDGSSSISEFSASFKAFVGGGTGGNGFAFCFGPDLPNERFDENGTGSGLIVTFDSSEDSGEAGTGVRVRFGNTTLTSLPFPRLRANRFVDVLIRWDALNGLDITYNNSLIVAGLRLPNVTELNGRFAFSARTETLTDWHCVDDLTISTKPALPRFLLSCSPTDGNAAPDAVIEIAVRDADKANLQTVRLLLNGRVVEPLLGTNFSGATVFQYQPPALLEPGSSHTVQLNYVEPGPPARERSFSYSFGVNPHILISK